MAERATLGEILLRSGRVAPEDLERALSHQRIHGGYLGQALVALGIVSLEELEWSLAAQFDLPFVFPDAAAVDPDASGLVTPEWALANLAMPIMKVGRELVVVVDSPLRTPALDELGTRTGLRIQLALASPVKIREMIREVYARATAREERDSWTPCSLEEVLDQALAAHAPRFGISVRSRRAWFWWEDGGTIRRRSLDTRWQEALDAVMDPSPSGQLGGAPSKIFSASIARDGTADRVEARYLAGEDGLELLFRPAEEGLAPIEPVPPPGEGVLTEVRLLARSGTARFIVSSDPPDLGRELLPRLPALFFDPSWRSIHLCSGERPTEGVPFSVRLSGGPGDWSQELEALRAFHFDVVTADLAGSPQEWLGAVVDLASVAFIPWDGGDTAPAREAGIGWRLRVARGVGSQLEWLLEALDR